MGGSSLPAARHRSSTLRRGATTNPLSKMREALTSEPRGWHARLFREWVLYNAVAFTIILATVYLLAGTGLDVTKQAAAHIVATLLIALAGALLYAGVLGSLQWLVIRQRITIPRRRWVVMNIAVSWAIWLLTVLPSVTHAATSSGNVQAAYLLAVTQALALGPILGIGQAVALRPLHEPLGLVDRRQHRLLALRRRRHLPCVADHRTWQLHPRRRIHS